MEEKYYHTKDSVDEYIKSAEGYSGKDLIERFIPHLKSNSRILELGSGPGSDWVILDKDFDTVGSDSSVEFLKRLREKYPKGEFLDIDASTIQTQEKFNAIYSNKVLHHLTSSELINSFTKQMELLNENGYICHSFWKGKGDEEFKGMYVNYHLEKDLEKLLNDNFNIVEMKAYAEFEENDSILLIAQKR